MVECLSRKKLMIFLVISTMILAPTLIISLFGFGKQFFAGVIFGMVVLFINIGIYLIQKQVLDKGDSFVFYWLCCMRVGEPDEELLNNNVGESKVSLNSDEVSFMEQDRL